MPTPIKNPEKWEITTCDWCGSGDSEFMLHGRDLLQDLPGEFTLVRCTQCGLIRQDPRLKWEHLESYYPEDYAAFEPIIETETSMLKRMDRRYGMWKRLKAVEQYVSGGRLLDVGAGTGIFLAEAHRSGNWEVQGLEPNKTAANYIQDHVKIPIIQEQFQEAEIQPGSFDVVTMWNVLEHFEQPIAELRKARNILSNGGMLICSIPNLHSLEAKIFGQYWLGWDLPRHLYQFPLDLLEKILSDLGFRLESMRCLATAHAALGLSILFFLKAKGLENAFVGRWILRLYYSKLSRLILSLPLKILDLLRLSSLIIIFARKVEDPKSPISETNSMSVHRK